MIEIDGASGEGGGQIIRSSLTLSLATGKAFRAVNVRANRSRPGLQKQHLTALRAAAEIGAADVRGDELHSRKFTFRPAKVRTGDFRFDIGTAGSTTLVLQTVLPVLLTAKGTSRLTLEGGTHNTMAPPYEFIERSLVPLLRRMGAGIDLTLERPGFYPVGGGKFRVVIEPAASLRPLKLEERGAIKQTHAVAVVSKLPVHIAERELNVIGRLLGLKANQLETVEETRARGPGNVAFVQIDAENVTEVFTGFGERGKKAETVGREAAEEAIEWLDADVPVGPHLADQLLLPLSLGSGGSYRTVEPTLHTLTNIETIRKFLDVSISVQSMDKRTSTVVVGGN